MHLSPQDWPPAPRPLFLVAGSAGAAAGSFTLPGPQQVVVLLTAVGVGLGACAAAIIVQVAKAKAEAFKIEADARKGTCQEQLERANARIDELIKRLADDEREAGRAAAERAIILDELKDSRHAIVELSQVVLVNAGFARRPGAGAAGEGSVRP